MTKKEKPPKPLKNPFELVVLGGVMTLVELTSASAVVRISTPGSPRAYQLGLPLDSLRTWVASVDDAVAAHEARLAAEEQAGYIEAPNGHVETPASLEPAPEVTA